jgi:hypothetical protein
VSAGLNATDYRRMATVALQIAIEAPLHLPRDSMSTYVRRSLIHEIRDLCDELGIDWRKALKEQLALDRAARSVAGRARVSP